jgi:hypothetical protein
MNERTPIIAVVLALTGCAAAPPTAPTMAIPAVAPPPAGCEATTRAYTPLSRLVAQSTAPDAATADPTDPEGMRRELVALIGAARAASPGDAEMAGLIEDMDARFSGMVARLGAFTEARSASHGDEARAAIEALLAAAKASTSFVASSHRRCDSAGPVKPVTGRLPPELIQKIVRSRFGDFRRCYENALRLDPAVQGLIAVRFVIRRDGSVGDVREADSAPGDAFAWGAVPFAAKPPPRHPSMLDATVSACVVATFKKLEFPAPESGIVTVTYPIMFAPGG